MTGSGQVGRRHAEARPLLQGDPLETFGDARHCAVDGCITLLSRYNPSPLCGEHRGWRDVQRKRTRRTTPM